MELLKRCAEGRLARRAQWLAICVIGLAAMHRAQAADELSGADKLRTLYSAEFRFTPQGVPIVPVAIAQAIEQVTVAAEPPSTGLIVLPDGDDGPEVESSESLSVAATATVPARMRYWPVAFRGKPGAGAEAAKVLNSFKNRGMEAHLFEVGALFGVAGEVMDRRELLVGVAPANSPEGAQKNADRLRTTEPVPPSGIHAEMVERPHGRLTARGPKGGLVIHNEGMLWVASRGDAPLRISGTRKGGGAFSGTYHGRLCFTIGQKGDLVIVNAVPENRLLAGLVPAEIFPSAPDEALKAQAVAARGELLAKIGTRHHGEPFRLCAETHCQVYAGAGKETPRTTAAVEATRGEILFAGPPPARELVDTVYSASCGGHTEHNENAWMDMPPESALRGHLDGPDAAHNAWAGGVTSTNLERFLSAPPATYCGRARIQGGPDRFRWTVTRSAAELERLLADRRLGAVRAIEVLERGVSGRAKVVSLTGSLRSDTIRGELNIRRAFGNLRSALFAVEVKDGAATFRGGGFGHGVGLCQTGAVGMAEAGKSYREILQHYYQRSTLRKLW
jgi:stage II sporulation protein D